VNLWHSMFVILHGVFVGITGIFPATQRQVEQEDYDLCTLAQKALNAGVYSVGRLHSSVSLLQLWTSYT